MVLEGISSPHRRTQNGPFSTSSSFRKILFPREELGNWSTLLKRHKFLLTMMVVLVVLCTIYLYFAVTLGGNGTCSGLIGTEQALCRLEAAKASVGKGKLKFL
ncbi:hypothetical protein ACHQM5_028907 [Ranunculus cassubicifolius]